jgi:hypothetical protein
MDWKGKPYSHRTHDSPRKWVDFSMEDLMDFSGREAAI